MYIDSSFAPLSFPNVRRIVKEFFGYFAVSLAGLAADSAVLLFLVSVCGMPVVHSSVVAFMTGLGVVYLCSVRFVFASRRVANQATEFFFFAMLGLAGLLLTIFIMYMGTRQLHVDYRLTKAVAAGASFVCNFALRKLVLFSKA